MKPLQLQGWCSVRNPTIVCTPSEVSYVGAARPFSWTTSTFFWEEQFCGTQNLPTAWLYMLVLMGMFVHFKETDVIKSFSEMAIFQKWSKNNISIVLSVCLHHLVFWSIYGTYLNLIKWKLTETLFLADVLNMVRYYAESLPLFLKSDQMLTDQCDTFISS